MRKQKRQIVKKLMQCAAVIAAGALAIILFMLAIWYRGNDLKQCKTPQEVYDGYLQITGYCKCCVDCDFIEEKDADELMHLAAYLAGNEQARAEAQQKAGKKA